MSEGRPRAPGPAQPSPAPQGSPSRSASAASPCCPRPRLIPAWMHCGVFPALFSSRSSGLPASSTACKGERATERTDRPLGPACASFPLRGASGGSRVHQHGYRCGYGSRGFGWDRRVRRGGALRIRTPGPVGARWTWVTTLNLTLLPPRPKSGMTKRPHFSCEVYATP